MIIDRGVNGFTIKLKNGYSTLVDILRITFTSKYTTDNIDDKNDGKSSKNNTVLRNQAVVNFKDHKDIDRSSTSTKDIEPRHEVINNGTKSGVYNEEKKEITWRVFVNYNGYELKNASIVDQVSDDQKLVSGSLKLKNFSVNNTNGNISVNEASDISLDDRDISDYNANKVEVKLPDGTGKYMLEFKTSLSGMIVLKEFTNTAQFINDNVTKNLTAKVTIPDGGKFVTKTAKQNNTTINWQVEVNLSRSTVSDAKVSDMPSNNTIIDKGSLKLYKYIYVNGSRVLDRNNPMVEGIDGFYTVSWINEDDKLGFEISFNDTISDAFRLEYNSEINTTEDNLSVSNKVVFTGNNERHDTNQEEGKYIIIDPKLASGAVGTQSSLKIVKYENETTIPIVGARIQLINSKGNVVGDEITDTNGEIHFSKKVRGTYKLREIVAPTGYHISRELSNGVPVTIPNKDGENEVAFKIYNKPNKVILKKLNANNIELAGAKFKLEVKNSEGIYVSYNNEEYTSVKGGLEVSKLPLGEYRFVETSAVENYIKNTKPYEFVIVKDDAGFVETPEVKFINYQGSVELKKYALNSDAQKVALKGATYELYKKSAAGDQLINNNYTTNDNGLLKVDNLAPGEYYFIEKSSSDGYVADKNPIDFTVVSEATGKPDVVKLEATNYKANVSFKKLDENSKPLNGVKFKLQKLIGEDEYETLNTYTSQNGIVKATNLSVGDYRFIEIETVDGYIINSDPIEFTVNDSIVNISELSITLDDFINYQGKITLHKQGRSSNGDLVDLNGVVYKLYKVGIDEDVQVGEEYTTVDGGLININGLAPGDYYFIELSSVNGYIIDENKIEFSVDNRKKGQPETIELNPLNYKATAKLKKVDATRSSLLEIEFTLDRLNGTTRQFVKTYKSNETGTIIFEDLGVGDYVLSETKTNKKFILNTKTIQFNVPEKISNLEELNIDLGEFINYQGAVKLTKYAVDSKREKTILPNTMFEIYSGDNLIRSNLVSDENGVIYVEGLAPGEYYFKEIANEDGYIVNEKPIAFTIVNEAYEEAELIEVESINYKANVEFLKYDEYQNPLENTEFTLEKFIDGQYEAIDTYISDKDGKVVAQDIAVGDYRFVESKAVDGYILNTKVIEFNVPEKITSDEDNLVIKLDDYVNYQGKIIIEKVDSKNDKQLLDGAKFSIYTNDDQLVKKNIKTENGKVIVDKLSPGKYYVIETQAPDRYLKTDKKFYFEIASSYEEQPDIATIKISNKMIEINNKKETLPSTGNDISTLMMLLITVSYLLGTRYYHKNS